MPTSSSAKHALVSKELRISSEGSVVVLAEEWQTVGSSPSAARIVAASLVCFVAA
jgi:hypothetical protein